MKKLKYIFIPLLVFIVLRLLFITNFWENLELKARDLLFIIRGERRISDEIVIIEIGDDTFNSLDEQWPFPRDYYAHLIDNLMQAGAKEVIFDIEFCEKSDPISDLKLAQTAAKYRNIVFSGKLIQEIKDNYLKQQLLPPIKEITDRKLKWGTVNISEDSDGFVRSYELYQVRGKQKKYSIGVLALLDSSFEVEKDIEENRAALFIGDKQIPKNMSKRVLINFYGPPETFKHIDLADILDDADFELPNLDLDLYYEHKNMGVLKDKIVLVGITAEEFHDIHSTPFQSAARKKMAGVEIHANFIEMVLQNDFLIRFSQIHFLLIFLAAAYLLFFLNLKIKPSIGLLINFVLFIISIIAGYYLFKGRNIIVPILEIPALIIVVYILGLVFQYIETARERKFIKDAFKQYLSPKLVNELIQDPKKLEYGGVEKEITVLFSDIRSFTPYTESHNPKETVAILQEYLTEMVEVITRNNGTIDKFVGDAIVALFGTPVELDNHAYWACKAAFEMRIRLNELREKWIKERKDPFENGIGLNSGVATVGNLGSEQIFDYTAIGDTINAGARLESLTKSYETKNKIIISEETLNIARDRLIVEYIDEVKVKGKTKGIKIYSLLGIKEEI